MTQMTQIFGGGFWSGHSLQAQEIALAKSIFNTGICGELFLIPLVGGRVFCFPNLEFD